MSGYDYIRARLASIHGEIRYPRENVVELRGRVGAISTGPRLPLRALSPKTRSRTRCSPATRGAPVAQITADGKFLEKVREVIRFVKQA